MPFKIVRNDLTKMTSEAIVNTANPYPVVGEGTDYAVYSAAGRDRLLEKRKKIGEIQRGEAVMTPGFDLAAKYIIHTVGPVWQGGEHGEREILGRCYRDSLALAKSKKIKSIAFPLISAGSYGFPKDEAIRIATSEINSFLLKYDMLVYLVVFDGESVKLSERLYESIESFINDDYEKEAFEDEHPYAALDAIDERRLAARRNGRFAKNDAVGCYPFESEEEFFRESADNYSTGSAGDYLMESATAYPKVSANAMPFQGKALKKRSLDDLADQQYETFQQMLLRLIKEKGYKNAEVYRRANQDKQLFSKIKRNVDYQPKKKTVMAFAIALRLNRDETVDLLARAGYAFSPSILFDRVIECCIENEIYNIIEVETILFDRGLETLCNY